MARTVIRTLVAEGGAVVDAGSRVDSYSIQRTAEGYIMNFVLNGRDLRCSLAEFQSRTQTDAATVDESPARKAETIA